ncbi:3-oxoacyl-ACP reductase [Erythrobacter sp. HI0063]|jgi:NAD(P)-dependent dehydrogenase (short-subunit alcohol dehydrogenase family)|uniref:SDR family NAD(P)-dependent oxidoreductase n=1 Tax=Erythrobacter sp. HI0063 TaxID=1822240 RepID=UPI0007C2EDA1|nr:SDR family NAD(P)-dependent oxidoreductase [Erythrobacter sp. HI0063]KZY57211.1 3-oxoacyl-ACP reductase [Erythrobacter sp. HI0063]
MTGEARRALVTGAGQGIGAAIVRRLVADGCAVTAIDRDGAALDRLAEETGARPLLLDLTDQRAIAGALADAPAFAVVVNNAGIDQHAFFTDTTPEDWRRLLAINLEAVFAITHVTLPAMRAAGAGRIVMIASEAGRLGSRGGAVYAAAKAGVIGFARSIARENADRGITANVVAPGPVDTPLLRAAVNARGERLLHAMEAAPLMGRLGTPEEVAAAVGFLASEGAAFVTGEVLGVSGGMGCGA